MTSYLSAAVMAFGTAPVFAQENPKAEQGQRPNSSGGSQGSAVSRPSGGTSGGGSSTSGGGSSTSGGGSSTSSSAGSAGRGPSSGSSGSSSAGSGSRARPGSGGYSTDVAPPRPERRAVPRDTGSSGDQRRVSPGTGSTPSTDASNDRRRAVPAYSRPNNGRPAIGEAVERRGRPPVNGGVGGSYYYYDPYYRFGNYRNRSPYGYYSSGYGFGMGYFYDPAMWGYYSPYGYGGGYDPYYGSGGGYGGYSRESYRDVGALRLKVKPEHGQVYVDGYYVGEIDSFDGVFQKLPIEAGAHRVEIRAPGYETVQFEVMVIAGETVTYKGDLKRVQ
jgi:hypothetical protein